MVLRYGVLKNASPTDNIDIAAYCEQFYSTTDDDPYLETMGVFSSFKDANLYAKHQMNQLRYKGKSNVKYPIYAIEYADDDVSGVYEGYRFGLFSGSYVNVGTARVLIDRRVSSQSDYHLMSRITNIYLLNEETDTYEQQPSFETEWQSARYSMLTKRLGSYTSISDVTPLIQKLLATCREFKNQGSAKDEEIADALALIDDAVNKRLSHVQFEKRLNKLQGNSAPSDAMQRVGTILAAIGAILIASCLFLFSAGTAAAGAGYLAAGAGFFAAGAARSTGLCKLTGELNINSAPYFQR